MSTAGNRIRKLDDQQLSELGALREAGKPLSALVRRAAKMGVQVTESAISWQMLRIGADLPPDRRRPGNVSREPYYRGSTLVTPFTPEEDKRIRAMPRTGEGIGQVARALGRKYHSVLGRSMTLARLDERAEEGA